MTTAAEYRAWAEESLKWASEAVTPEERDAHIRSAEFWLQSALRSERLSQQPPTTEYEWVLPPELLACITGKKTISDDLQAV